MLRLETIMTVALLSRCTVRIMCLLVCWPLCRPRLMRVSLKGGLLSVCSVVDSAVVLMTLVRGIMLCIVLVRRV